MMKIKLRNNLLIFCFTLLNQVKMTAQASLIDVSVNAQNINNTVIGSNSPIISSNSSVNPNTNFVLVPIANAIKDSSVIFTIEPKTFDPLTMDSKPE